MNYQVLARKWRPHNFTEVVGQSHVVQSLLNALQHNRLNHAYLFTGTRGVGKTTLARILAKAINCEQLQNFNPCGVCAICRAVDEGRFLDLIEVDAASRTKVEDTRDLLDNAQYAPNQGRYKVYLIDEVHMLSGHSFNALLKTLEEPPLHVKFLLATTDPHKIPVTVLSRCLQFNLKRLLPSQIFAQMEFILGQENIAFEPAALKLLARSADGSMRDSLSLLDQAIVFGNGKVLASDVNAMLGTVAQQPIEDILTALASGNASAILDKIEEIAHLSPDFSDVLAQLLQQLHRIALVQHVPTAVDAHFDGEMISQLAKQLTLEDVQLYYQIGLLGQKDLELTPDPRSGFEMVMLRMLTFRPANVTSNVPKASSQPKHVLIPVAPIVTQIASPPPSTIVDDEWQAMIDAMQLTGFVRALANNCALDYIDDTICSLFIAPNSIRTESAVEKLEQALRAYRRTSLKLSFTEKAEPMNNTPSALLKQQQANRQQAAVDALHADQNIQALKTTFEARILAETIQPI